MWRRHRLKLLIAAAATIITVGVLLIAFRVRTEPKYKGQTMIEWLWAPDTHDKEEAIVILGTNHLHLLVHRLKYDSTKDRVFMVFMRLPNRIKNIRLLRNLWAQNELRAAVAFKVMKRLGPRAAPAVPELAEIARNASANVALRTLLVLSSIGDPAIPGVAAGMSNANSSVRAFALFTLQDYRSSPAAWQAITNALNDPDFSIRQQAAALVKKSDSVLH